jgi:tetratricopeptide (TPR) repeat protein
MRRLPIPPRAIHLLVILAILPASAALLAGAAANPVTAPVVVPPASAEADAETYARCMKLAQNDPGAAQRLALSWRQRGGAHPADHCAAVALIGLGKYREGAMKLEALERVMTKAPTALRAEVLDQAGQAWLLAGDPQGAYATAGKAVALLPGDPELRIDRAEAAASAGLYDQAIADLDIVLKKDPNRVEALIYRAAAYRALDRLDPALADIDKALTYTPDSAPALLERGNIRRLKDDPAGARRDWRRVGEISPGSQADMAARVNLDRLAQDPNAALPAAVKPSPP